MSSTADELHSNVSAVLYKLLDPADLYIKGNLARAMALARELHYYTRGYKAFLCILNFVVDDTANSLYNSELSHLTRSCLLQVLITSTVDLGSATKSVVSIFSFFL